MHAFVKGKLFFTQTLAHLYTHQVTVKQDFFPKLNKLITGLFTHGTKCRLCSKTESRSFMRVDYCGLTCVKVLIDHGDSVTFYRV